jgi:hypothetical protein
VVWYSELKGDLSRKDAYEEAIGQARTRATEIFKQHATRHHVIAALFGCNSMELWYFSRSGPTYRSTIVPVGEANAVGTNLLLRLFYSKQDSHFGFIVPMFPLPFTVAGQTVNEFKLLRPAGCARRGTRVYSALVDGSPAVVKCSTSSSHNWHEASGAFLLYGCPIEAAGMPNSIHRQPDPDIHAVAMTECEQVETLKLLHQHRIKHAPRLLGTADDVPGSDGTSLSCIVTQPLGEHLCASDDPAVIVQVRQIISMTTTITNANCECTGIACLPSILHVGMLLSVQGNNTVCLAQYFKHSCYEHHAVTIGLACRLDWTQLRPSTAWIRPTCVTRMCHRPTSSSICWTANGEA